MIEIDGAEGEGGGQVLRTALTLSMLTSQPFHMVRVRSRRPRPGILAQHLAAIRAATRLCDAQVAGAAIDSQEFVFRPRGVTAGRFEIAIGTAGSATLVLQTLLLPLILASGDSMVRIKGGTHNPGAPPFEFLQHAYLPLLGRMGADLTMELAQYGFYPRGGGELVARVSGPRLLRPLDLGERGHLIEVSAEARLADLPRRVGERELAVVQDRLGWPAERLRCIELPQGSGPGNTLSLIVRHDHVTEVFTAFGQRGVPAEAVAERASGAVLDYLRAPVAVGPHLADQLLLPLAVAGSGRFTTLSRVSRHFETNAAVIAKFLPVRVKVDLDAEACDVRVQRHDP